MQHILTDTPSVRVLPFHPEISLILLIGPDRISLLPPYAAGLLPFSYFSSSSEPCFHITPLAFSFSFIGSNQHATVLHNNHFTS